MVKRSWTKATGRELGRTVQLGHLLNVWDVVGDTIIELGVAEASTCNISLINK